MVRQLDRTVKADHAISEKRDEQAIFQLHKERVLSVGTMCYILKISRKTLHRTIENFKIPYYRIKTGEEHDETKDSKDDSPTAKGERTLRTKDFLIMAHKLVGVCGMKALIGRLAIDQPWLCLSVHSAVLARITESMKLPEQYFNRFGESDRAIADMMSIAIENPLAPIMIDLSVGTENINFIFEEIGPKYYPLRTVFITGSFSENENELEHWTDLIKNKKGYDRELHKVVSYRNLGLWSVICNNPRVNML